MADFYMNESHVKFIFKNAFFLGPYLLDRFLGHLDEIDIFDRHRFLGGWIYSSLGIAPTHRESVDEQNNEENEIEDEYKKFKNKCRELVSKGMSDYFLVQSIISFTLTVLWDAADETFAEREKIINATLLKKGQKEAASKTQYSPTLSYAKSKSA